MFKRYGKTFGMYQGSQQLIATIDPEVMQSVLVKNGDSFIDTFDIELPDKHTTLDSARGNFGLSFRSIY